MCRCSEIRRQGSKYRRRNPHQRCRYILHVWECYTAPLSVPEPSSQSEQKQQSVSLKEDIMHVAGAGAIHHFFAVFILITPQFVMKGQSYSSKVPAMPWHEDEANQDDSTFTSHNLHVIPFNHSWLNWFSAFRPYQGQAKGCGRMTWNEMSAALKIS